MEGSVGTSDDRASVAAHVSVLSLKGWVFGLSMVEERLECTAHISIVECSAKYTHLHA